MNPGRPRGAVRDNQHMLQLMAVPGAIVYGVDPGQYTDETNRALRVAEYSGFTTAEARNVPADGGGVVQALVYSCLQALMNHGQLHQVRRKLVSRNHNLDSPQPTGGSYLFGTRARAQAYADALQQAQAAGAGVNKQAGAAASRQLDPETTGLVSQALVRAALEDQRAELAQQSELARQSADRIARGRKIPSALLKSSDGEAMTLKMYARQQKLNAEIATLKNFSKYITHDPYNVDEMMNFKLSEIKKGKY
jgi:hypothetical protein